MIESRDSRGERLDLAGLATILGRLDIGSPNLLIPTLMENVAGLHPGKLSEDDVTLLLFSPNRLFETAGMPGFKHHWEAMKKFGKALIRPDEPVPWPDLHPANLGGACIRSLNRLWGRRLGD